MRAQQLKTTVDCTLALNAIPGATFEYSPGVELDVLSRESIRDIHL